MTDSTFDWFSKYRMCRSLGQGGMGIIYLAEDVTNGDERCVVKQLITRHESSSEQEEAVRLFRREVEILKTLDHPGIVSFFDDHTTADGKYFLVMDFVEGQNLDLIVKTFGAFSIDETIKIGIQCCEVLEYLHDREPPVIYRDLKPSNLMLTPDGQIVFIDFGIARNFMPKDAATRVVTAGYSPPEQYFGKPETRSDLYALGASMAHLVGGSRPKPLSPTYPLKKVPDLMPEFEKLLTRLTAQSPQDRPESARKVRYELYAIYSKLHPEFEIPQEALGTGSSHDREASSTASGDLKVLHWSKDPVINEVIQRSKVPAARSRAPGLEKNSDKDANSDTSKLWRKLRSWLKNDQS